MEELLIQWLREYGYPILFVWSIAEGEIGLVMAGLLCHTGDMNIFISIGVAAFGGFIGDQIYFYLGRYNRQYTLDFFHTHRRKVALAHLLLRKYGWPVIFAQRYLYGLRTIIPMAIGTTKYDNKQFALINFLSAIVWASLTITLTYIFGDVILRILLIVKSDWYFALPFAFIMLGLFYFYVNKYSQPRKRRTNADRV
jgi:membrane protein DedA with SNARE-associated domain